MVETTPNRPEGSEDENPFRLLVQAVTDYAIYLLNPDGVITSWNTGAERAKGYTEQEVIGQHFSIFFTPEDLAAGLPQRALKTARETGRFESEGWRVRKDGTRFWALAVLDAIRDGRGRFIGYAKITRDLSERRAAELRLAESERRFRLLVTSVVDYALFMIDPQGYVTNWNTGAQRIKGYSADEIVGQHFSVFYTEEDRAAGLPQRVLAAATAGKFEGEGWRVRKDGSRFWASVVVDPIRDEDGTLLGFAKITRDISERRALEEAKEQLHQAQKMETVGQLTGGVAHDFNNLLTAVSNSLELIAQISADGRIQRLAETAQRAVARGAKLTSQLLAFSRRQTLTPQTSDLNELISVFDALLHRAVGDMIQIALDLEPQLWLAEVDQGQFQSALLNLVVNARDAMAETGGGTLTVCTRNVTVDGARAATLREIEPGDYVEVAVSDTGVGMAPEVRAKAIEPFYTTKEVGKGSGLGLSQVYGFARQSHGQLDIESEPGRGTTVRLYLPRSPAGAMDDATARRRAKSRKCGSILVVEDDPEVLDVTVEMLRSFGYEVYAAANAPEALAILERDAPIDCLFTDIVMPKGMDGLELARRALDRRPRLRVLLTSGYAREAMERQRPEVQGMEFIGKPYRLPDLAERLRSMMGCGG